MLTVAPVTLSGRLVRLEPLSHEHVADLTLAGADESIWQLMLYGMVTNKERMHAWVDHRLQQQAEGNDLPFAVIYLPTGRAIGSTRYMDIRPKDRGLEIGGTWYGVKYQRTGVNTECKYLLLSHAFEQYGCIRVQFKTDARNLRSQRALERIGAIQEGTLRNHMITPEGIIRHSVYYSIVESEWPAVKARIETLMERHPKSEFHPTA
jgi:RimJ/RimL family protein N-acetyltransferase